MEILNRVFELSIVGSIIFSIFMILKPLTKKHFNSSWHYKILVLTLIFFLLSINNFIDLPVKPLSSISKPEIKEVRSLETINPYGETNHMEDNKPVSKENPDNRRSDRWEKENPSPIKNEDRKLEGVSVNIEYLRSMVLYIWLIGGISLFLIKIIQYIKLKAFIAKHSMEVTQDEILDLFDACKDELGIKKKVGLRTSSLLGPPLLIGLVEPRVLIPSTNEDYKRLRMIFLHELNHYKRKDIIIKVLALIINAIHWFNPFIYILLGEIDKYCEYSIDEKVVEKMDINDRKYYGETILSLIGSSMIRQTSFTRSMGSNGRQLKNRLENMIYSFKTSRKKTMASLLIGVLIFVSGFTVACSVLPDKTMEDNNSFAVYIKEDGLYYSYLDGGEEVKIHEGRGFENPLASKDGAYIAYTRDGSLYIYNIGSENYEKIDDEIEDYYRAYDWIDDETIIYASNRKGGIRILNLASKEEIQHLDEYYYTGLVASRDRMVYATRIDIQTREEGDFIKNEGVVEIDLNKYDNNRFQTSTIVKAKETTEENIGSSPMVWKISDDGRYIYIMEKYASASLSADGIGLGIYDVEEKSYRELTDITSLAYTNNLTINPNNNNMIGLVQGAGREMIENKEVILLKVIDGTNYQMLNFIEEDLLAMTPSFSLDGKRLFYSATKNIVDNISKDFASPYDQWNQQAHHIYEYDLERLEINKLTDGEYFDFMPMDISNDEMLFIRYGKNDNYSLIKLVDGKENIIVDNLIFNGGSDNDFFGFYGHIETERAMDVFIKRGKKDYGKTKSSKQDKPTDILEELSNKEFFIKETASSYSNKELVIEFGKSFVNLFTGAVAKQEKVSFDRYISNTNLHRYTDTMLELTQIQDEKGSSMIHYGLENVFGSPILREHPEDGLWYLELPFEFEGSGMTAKMLIVDENKVLKLADIYFGTKDGVDTFATGHPADREVKDPSIWEDEDWVQDVFSRLEKFEYELNIPHKMHYQDPYANPPLNMEIEAGKQILTRDEMDLYMKYRRPKVSEKS